MTDDSFSPGNVSAGAKSEAAEIKDLTGDISILVLQRPTWLYVVLSVLSCGFLATFWMCEFMARVRKLGASSIVPWLWFFALLPIPAVFALYRLKKVLKQHLSEISEADFLSRHKVAQGILALGVFGFFLIDVAESFGFFDLYSFFDFLILGVFLAFSSSMLGLGIAKFWALFAFGVQHSSSFKVEEQDGDTPFKLRWWEWLLSGLGSILWFLLLVFAISSMNKGESLSQGQYIYIPNSTFGLSMQYEQGYVLEREPDDDAEITIEGPNSDSELRVFRYELNSIALKDLMESRLVVFQEGILGLENVECGSSITLNPKNLTEIGLIRCKSESILLGEGHFRSVFIEKPGEAMFELYGSLFLHRNERDSAENIQQLDQMVTEFSRGEQL